MRLAHTKAGEPLDELAERVYALEGGAGELRAASRALREANPFLRKLSDVPEGTLLVVPELESAAPAEETQPLEGALAALLVSRLREAATQAIEVLAGELDEEAADARSSLEVLRDPATRRLVRADDEARLAYAATEDAARARLAAAERLGGYRAEVAAQVERDLDELLDTLHATGRVGSGGSGGVAPHRR